MNYYENIKEELISNEVYKKIKDYSKNRSDLKTYYNVGKMLSEAGKHYGEGIIKEYSKKLTNDLGKGYTQTRLKYNMKNLYEKLQTVSAKLTWSHYTQLLSFDSSKIIYYTIICEQQNLSVRQLRERIKNKEYERLDNKSKYKLIKHNYTSFEDYIKNPVIIKNSTNYEIISEKILQKLILEDIPSFLKELGNSFCFISNEYKIKIGNTYNYIDLLYIILNSIVMLS